MVETSRVELDELHVLDLRARAPRERYAVASRRVGIAGVEIDLAAAACRKHRVGRADRVYLARRLVEDVCADAAVGALEPDALRHHEVDHYCLLPDVDGRAADAAYHRRLALLACDVACVEDAPRAVPALAGKLPRAVLLLRELDAALDEVLYSLGRVLADLVHDGGVAEPGAGDHRVARVLVERVGRICDAADATLREIRVAVLQPPLCHEHDLALAREMQGRHEPCHPGPDDEVVAIDDFHYGAKLLQCVSCRNCRRRGSSRSVSLQEHPPESS